MYEPQLHVSMAGVLVVRYSRSPKILAKVILSTLERVRIKILARSGLKILAESGLKSLRSQD